MRRFAFYILAAALTFAAGSFAAFKFYRESKSAAVEEKPETAAPKDFLTKTAASPGSANTKNEQYFPVFAAQKTNERKQPFCRNRKILPVWNLIRKDKYFLEQSGGSFSSPNCSDMFEALDFDLNGDGAKEILLRGKSDDLCGGTGNCGFWIFERKGRRYRKILSDTDYADLTKTGGQIQRRKTHGYSDILLKGHLNAADTRYATYKFNGRKYVESKCLVNYLIRGSSDNPKWKFITCREYQKREGY